MAENTLASLFLNSDHRKPISYRQFAADGMTRQQYLSYTEKCETLRQAIMLLSSSSDPLIPRTILDEKQKEKILQHITENVFQCVSEIIDKPIKPSKGVLYKITQPHWINFWHDIGPLVSKGVRRCDLCLNETEFRTKMESLIALTMQNSHIQMDKDNWGAYELDLINRMRSYSDTDKQIDLLLGWLNTESIKQREKETLLSSVVYPGDMPEDPDDPAYYFWLKAAWEAHEDEDNAYYEIEKAQDHINVIKTWLKKLAREPGEEDIGEEELFDACDTPTLYLTRTPVPLCDACGEDLQIEPCRISILNDYKIVTGKRKLNVFHCTHCGRYQIQDLDLRRFELQYNRLIDSDFEHTIKCVREKGEEDEANEENDVLSTQEDAAVQKIDQEFADVLQEVTSVFWDGEEVFSEGKAASKEDDEELEHDPFELLESCLDHSQHEGLTKDPYLDYPCPVEICWTWRSNCTRCGDTLQKKRFNISTVDLNGTFQGYRIADLLYCNVCDCCYITEPMLKQLVDDLNYGYKDGQVTVLVARRPGGQIKAPKDQSYLQARIADLRLGINELPGTSFSSGEFDLSDQSFLKRMGYDTYQNDKDRQAILQEACRTYGRRQVADLLLYHVRMRKKQQGGEERYSRAIGVWEKDIDFLTRQRAERR